MKNHNSTNKKLILSGCFLAAAVVAAVVILLIINRNDAAVEKELTPVTGAEDYKAESSTEPDSEEIQENPSINIPGYGTITLKAGQTEQDVCFNNPEENTCYFKMSLILSDGTVIWQSDLLEPGKAFDKITLNQTLPGGEYPDTILKYDCYSRKDQSQLNGAEIKLNLVVK